MNDIQVFNSEQFGEIRTAGTAQEPIFCAADICRALGYSNGRKAISDHCDEGDVTKRDTPCVAKRDRGQNLAFALGCKNGRDAVSTYDVTKRYAIIKQSGKKHFG